jgi:hypothetical protein
MNWGDRDHIAEGCRDNWNSSAQARRYWEKFGRVEPYPTYRDLSEVHIGGAHAEETRFGDCGS